MHPHLHPSEDADLANWMLFCSSDSSSSEQYPSMSFSFSMMVSCRVFWSTPSLAAAGGGVSGGGMWGGRGGRGVRGGDKGEEACREVGGELEEGTRGRRYVGR